MRNFSQPYLHFFPLFHLVVSLVGCFALVIYQLMLCYLFPEYLSCFVYGFFHRFYLEVNVYPHMTKMRVKALLNIKILYLLRAYKFNFGFLKVD